MLSNDYPGNRFGFCVVPDKNDSDVSNIILANTKHLLLNCFGFEDNPRKSKKKIESQYFTI
jgi:hypothetical protein